MSARRNPRTKYCGVYGLRCIATGEIYIGGSTDMTGRWAHHRFNLRRNQHKTPALQSKWLEYGEEAFEFVVLERCSKEQLLDLEDKWIANTPNRLNWGDKAFPPHTGPSETKKIAARRRWARPEYRAKRSEWLTKRTALGQFIANN